MFLEVLRRRNPRFVETAISLHQQGLLPPNTLVIDLDSVEANARVIKVEAGRLGLEVLAMTKQMGRNPAFARALIRGGIDKVVAVDMAGARACKRAGLGIGHLGHLVQIPRSESAEAARLEPDYWTVYSEEKARAAAQASQDVGRNQPLMARIHAPGDTFYRGHEGGFPAYDIVEVAAMLDGVSGGRFAGITTFPALLFDQESRSVKPTPNLATLQTAAAALVEAGYSGFEINAPGTSSMSVLEILRAAGATQCEPGHGLTGTTPWHALEDLPEVPAALYLSEVSHLHHGDAFCFGGGLYIDPVFPAYDVKALVSSEPTVAAERLYDVEIPPPSAIDYYGMIDSSSGPSRPAPGDSVVFGFRAQAFVTRANTAGVSGISRGEAKIEGIYDGLGNRVELQGVPADRQGDRGDG
ncbi:MAG: alanine racemase [Trueperaceae bacterium]